MGFVLFWCVTCFKSVDFTIGKETLSVQFRYESERIRFRKYIVNKLFILQNNSHSLKEKYTVDAL